MGMRYVFNPAAFIILSVFVASAATACTTISFQNGGAVLLGGNEDLSPDTANRMLSRSGMVTSGPRDFMASVLKVTHQSHFTIYSFIYDLGNLKIHLYYDRQFANPMCWTWKKNCQRARGFERLL